MLSTVFTNDIRQTLDQFRRSVDHLFGDLYGYASDRGPSSPSERNESTFSPALETTWDEQMVRLRAILPGVRPGDVDVALQGNQLIVSGERKVPEGFEKNGFTHLAYGKFTTAIALPNGLDVENVKCELHDGVLDIAIPIAESMKPRQIPVQIGNSQKSIAA